MRLVSRLLIYNFETNLTKNLAMQINDTFNSYNDMVLAVDNYFKENNHTATKSDSKKSTIPDVDYKYIEWTCVHKSIHETVSGAARIRNRLYYRPLGCTMKLRIFYDEKSAKYKVKQLISTHCDSQGKIVHIPTQDDYDNLAPNRKLNSMQTNKVIDGLSQLDSLINF